MTAIEFCQRVSLVTMYLQWCYRLVLSCLCLLTMGARAEASDPNSNPKQSFMLSEQHRQPHFYRTVARSPYAEQLPVLAIPVEITFATEVHTVRQAVERLLVGTGYRLAVLEYKHDSQTYQDLDWLFNLELPSAHRLIRQSTVDLALLSLIGPEWRLIVDRAHRLITFERVEPLVAVENHQSGNLPDRVPDRLQESRVSKFIVESGSLVTNLNRFVAQHHWNLVVGKDVVDRQILVNWQLQGNTFVDQLSEILRAYQLKASLHQPDRVVVVDVVL